MPLKERQRIASLKWARKNRDAVLDNYSLHIEAGFCGQCKKRRRVKNRASCKSCLAAGTRKSSEVWKGVKRTKDAKKANLIELLGGKCKDCGYAAHPAALEFDHLRDKKMAISNMLNQAYKWETILEEVAKCELVCANCHSIRTFNRLRGITCETTQI